MTEQELTELVTRLSKKADCSAAVVLLDPLQGARLRYAITSSDDLLNAAVTLLCAAAARLSTAAPECQGCASKLLLVDRALSDLGVEADKRGEGGASPALQALH